MGLARLIHGSSQPAGKGITIGTPRRYEALMSLPVVGLRRSLRALVAAGEARPGDRVLDVGCGTGAFARLLAEAVGPEGEVVGVDAAPEMVAYASRRARTTANCRFQVGAAESLAFPAGRFDVVVCSLVLHHLPEELRLPALREMRRVLGPSGRLLVAEFQVAGGHAWHLLSAVTVGPAMAHRVPRLEPLVAEAGFADVRSGDVPPWLHYVRAARQGGHEALGAEA